MPDATPPFSRRLDLFGVAPSVVLAATATATAAAAAQDAVVAQVHQLDTVDVNGRSTTAWHGTPGPASSRRTDADRPRSVRQPAESVLPAAEDPPILAQIAKIGVEPGKPFDMTKLAHDRHRPAAAHREPDCWKPSAYDVKRIAGRATRSR